jgi:adenylosuccinate lyase
VVHRAGTRTIARVDALWSEASLVVEVSGRIGHATDLEREQQAIRRDELEELGLRVKELSYDQVVHRRDETEHRLRRWLTSPVRAVQSSR